MASDRAVAPPRSCARRSAPRSRSSRSRLTVRGYEAATSSGVRSVSERAFTFAPRATRSRTLSTSGTAHSSAVAPPGPTRFASAPCLSRTSTISAFANTVAVISAGIPSASTTLGLAPVRSSRSTSPTAPRWIAAKSAAAEVSVWAEASHGQHRHERQSTEHHGCLPFAPVKGSSLHSRISVCVANSSASLEAHCHRKHGLKSCTTTGRCQVR